jgi:poly-beta-1,6-N-acetyl-D-glucosamine synthase
MPTTLPSYALVTPARNEADYIEGTLKSMIAQGVKPSKWVIVSDGSTDGTDDIVKCYAENHPWMELVRLPEERDRNFAAKVSCFNAGFNRLDPSQYHIVGNLDADLSFDPDYFEYLISKFAENELLGVGGTPFVEGDDKGYDYRFTNIEHVSGACQMFRKACFEEIGGYIPIKIGGIDWVAVTTARMKGWQTRTFTDKVLHHHRPMGTGNGTLRQALFKLGRQDYFLGGHPFWQLLRSTYQMAKKPYLLGGTMLFWGYFWSMLKREKKPVPQELIDFQQREQMKRLKKLIFRTSP